MNVKFCFSDLAVASDLKPDTKTSKPLFFSLRLRFFTAIRFWTVYVNQPPASKWHEYRRCGWAKPLMFPDCLLKCLMSLYALIGGNGSRMWLHLLGNVSCPYGSRRPHIGVYPVSTAHRLVHELLWFLVCVTDFYMAWMPVVPVNILNHDAWRPAVYCSQGFFEFSNLELK